MRQRETHTVIEVALYEAQLVELQIQSAIVQCINTNKSTGVQSGALTDSNQKTNAISLLHHPEQLMIFLRHSNVNVS